MCSKDLTELPELKELLNRLIVRKHMCSVAVASLLPLLLGYIAYRKAVDLGARLVPQDLFFFIGLFAARQGVGAVGKRPSLKRGDFDRRGTPPKMRRKVGPPVSFRRGGSDGWRGASNHP